jgi:lipoteichoic acid synthase
MLHYQWVIDQFEANDDRDTPDDSIIYYLAANKEFDLALDELKTSLIEAGQWDNTVIMIFGDHYAYAIDDEVIWDYDENKVEGDLDSELRLHNVPMMICVGDGTTTETANCSGGDDNILQGTISNYMSTIDIIPTVANLFNLPLDDYRLVFGEDALSTDKNIVRFADMSFISKDFSYDSLSEKYALKNGFISDSLFFKTYYYNIVNEYEYNLNMLNLDYFRDQEDVDN